MRQGQPGRTVSDRQEELLTAATQLVAETLEHFGHVRFRASGTSMLPAIRSGDVLMVESCPGDRFRVGDVVVFMGTAGLVAHRLVATRGQVAVTRGDANWQSDLPTPTSRLLGRVTQLTRDGSPLSPSMRCSWTARSRGLLRNELLRCSRRLRSIGARAIGRRAEFQKRQSNPST